VDRPGLVTTLLKKLRQHPRLRKIARSLPVISAYERRIAALTAQSNAQAEQITILDDVIAGRRAGPDYLRIFAPPGHFYSPYPDVADLQAREAEVFGRDAGRIPGVDLRVDEQWALLDELAPHIDGLQFARTKEEATARGERYWSENPAYGDGDALFLTGMLRHIRPKRFVELGCGYSSARTLDVWQHDLDRSTELTFVDPYPQLLDSLLAADDRSRVAIHADRTQDVSLDLIRSLDAGDVLFIDSTHVAKTDSDVNHIFFEVLPALSPGVTVHLHDIFAGFEYPAEWVYERRAWTEQYVLRAFLQYNPAFEIVLWPTLLQRLDRERFTARFPTMTNSGGAFWFRKRAV
jgi:predicted O-methyltransferase YrrM